MSNSLLFIVKFFAITGSILCGFSVCGYTRRIIANRNALFTSGNPVLFCRRSGAGGRRQDGGRRSGMQDGGRRTEGGRSHAIGGARQAIAKMAKNRNVRAELPPPPPKKISVSPRRRRAQNGGITPTLLLSEPKNCLYLFPTKLYHYET